MVKVKAVGHGQPEDNLQLLQKVTQLQLFSALDSMASQDSQFWHDILTASNQVLELPKCGYHAIIFEFEPTGKPIMVSDPVRRITLKDCTGQLFNIEKWKTTTATKYLKAHKAPTG